MADGTPSAPVTVGTRLMRPPRPARMSVVLRWSMRVARECRLFPPSLTQRECPSPKHRI